MPDTNPNVRVLEITETFDHVPAGCHRYTIEIVTAQPIPLTGDPETQDVGFKFSNPDANHPLPPRP